MIVNDALARQRDWQVKDFLEVCDNLCIAPETLEFVKELPMVTRNIDIRPGFVCHNDVAMFIMPENFTFNQLMHELGHAFWWKLSSPEHRQNAELAVKANEEAAINHLEIPAEFLVCAVDDTFTLNQFRRFQPYSKSMTFGMLVANVNWRLAGLLR